MPQGHVFVTRRIPDPGLELLATAGADLTIGEDDAECSLSLDALIEGVSGCDVVVSLLTESIDRELLELNESLLGIAQMAVGYDNVDVAAATELGIPIANTPGVLTETTADLAWALLMSVARRVPEAHRYMVAGRYRTWGPSLFLGGDVGRGPNARRKVLGVIGYGRIGRAVARRSIGFDMDVLAWGPRSREIIEADSVARWADLDELLADSDFVSVHAPLTDESRHLIAERELRLMKPTAYLVNTARGPIVDETALVRALRERWIAGAGLDVYENEPAMAAGLADCDNAVLLPHIASASFSTRGTMATIAAENALALLSRQRAPNVVNPEVFERAAYRRRMGIS